MRGYVAEKTGLAEQSFEIDQAIGLAHALICSFCNVEEVPEGLMDIVPLLSVDMIRGGFLHGQRGQGVRENDAPVTHVSMGDVSFSFGDTSDYAECQGLLRKYQFFLMPFRKMRW